MPFDCIYEYTARTGVLCLVLFVGRVLKMFSNKSYKGCRLRVVYQVKGEHY